MRSLPVRAVSLSLKLPPRALFFAHAPHPAPRPARRDHLNFVVVRGVPLFFRVREGPYLPTLRLLHQYPSMMPSVRVDKGAVKFVLKGADVMCPGITSAGGDASVELPALAPVAVRAEGKEHALAVGFTRMSTADIRGINKGIGIESVHFCGDALWTAPAFE